MIKSALAYLKTEFTAGAETKKYTDANTRQLFILSSRHRKFKP